MDHLLDRSHAVLHRISRQLPFPDFVKEASLLTVEDARTLPAQSFADPVRRMFPIHDRANTWLSMAFFHKAGIDLSQLFGLSGRQMVCNILDKAAKLWDLTEERKRILTPPLEKTAAARVEIVFKVKDEVVDTVPLQDNLQLQKLASTFSQSRQLYPYVTRKDVARQLLRAEDTLGEIFTAEERSRLQKQAGEACGLLSDTLSCIAQRWRNVRDSHPELTEPLQGMQKAARDAAQNGFVAPECSAQIAAALDAIDRVLELRSKYAGAFSFPEDALFRWGAQDAASFQKHAAVLPGNRIVDAALLKEASTMEKAATLFGYDAAKDGTLEQWLKRMNSVAVEKVLPALTAAEPVL